MIIKKSIQRNLPIYLTSDTGSPITGVAWDDPTPPTVEYQKEGGSGLTSKVLSASNWIEIGNGKYEVVFTSGELDTKGFFVYFANADGAIQYPGLFQIGNNDIEDIVNEIWGYTTRTLTSFGTLISDIWSSVTRTLTAGTKDAEVDAIKAKTDNLPSDPTSETQATANKNEIIASCGGGSGSALPDTTLGAE